MLNEKGLENTVHPMLKYNLVHVWGAGLLLCSVLETCGFLRYRATKLQLY